MNPFPPAARMHPLVKTLTCLALLFAGGIAIAQPVTPIAQNHLLVYLDALTQWQRDMASIQPTSINTREIVFRDSLQENAGKVLQSGFTFMRSVANSEPVVDESDPESTRLKLTQRAAQIQQSVASLQAQAAKLSGNARKNAQEQIRLEQARGELVQTILANLNAASNKSPNKLRYTIESLARSIPELNPDMAKTSVVADAAPKRSGTSILSLSANSFEVTRKQRELDDALAKTTQLKKDSMALMKDLRSAIGEVTPEEQADEKEVAKPVPAMSVEARVAQYKQVGANIVPLAETMRWMDASKQTLKEWRDVLQQHREQLLRQLGVHLGILLVTLAIPLVLSEMVRRAVKRMPDQKRRRRLSTLRRIVTGIAVVFILMLNFISDFSSFATFAGFLTAGLAVALQSVLLSLVAHFLFYGRYGVRNGDRVNVAGVTGDIVQIGMVRFYLRELKETENGLEPTGKIVAFPNSIVFQNVAFYKYTE